jgi:hypothetical protein
MIAFFISEMYRSSFIILFSLLFYILPCRGGGSVKMKKLNKHGVGCVVCHPEQREGPRHAPVALV